MQIVGHSAPLLLLLLSSVFGVAETIRALKEGPVIDPEGREFKSPRFGSEAESNTGSRVNDSSPVRVQCTEASVIIVVDADLYRTGRRVSPGELFLGGAEHQRSGQCRAVAAGDGEFVIKAELQGCGSKLTTTEDSVIYSNTLVFSPAARHHGITRMARADVPVSCRYKRRHLVSSSPLQLVLTSSASRELSDFSLQLMTDDWRSVTTTTTPFFLGDILHLQASYTGPASERRRLFIDSCVATLSPDATSVPRYYFIENQGCLIDAKLGGSDTLFQPRLRANLLQLQLSTFLFDQDRRNPMFITCQLKAISQMWRSNPINKACNYVNSRWKNVDGYDDVCQCCESICSRKPPEWKSTTHPRGLAAKDMTACVTVTLGPLMIFPRK